MLGLETTVKEVIALTKKSNPRVLYLGTATYDESSAMDDQTKNFADLGCRVSALNVTWHSRPATDLQAALNATDIILISGGNTLFAVDRWAKLGMDVMIRNAVDAGAVVAGGSAGFISLCNGGHSDSMEPASYKTPPGPLLNADPAAKAEVDANWAYIRVPGIGLINNLCCPHYDMTGSNGVHRADDFTKMLAHHSGEYAIGIDNWAALVIDEDSYEVVSRAGYPGSVAAGGSFSANRTGIPGMWRLHLNSSGNLERILVPTKGFVKDLLTPPKYIVEDSQIAVARRQNPDDGHPPSWITPSGNPHWWF